MGALIVAGFFVGMLAMVGSIIYFSILGERKRTEALQSIAANIGLQFSETQSDLMDKLKAFPLFNIGHSRKLKNVLRAETDAAQLWIFDYSYTTGGGKNSHTHRHTIVAMESDELRLPEFTLRPEGILDKIGATLGFQDIDFEEHPEFSRTYALKGSDEASIRQFFDIELLNRLSTQKEARVETQRNAFIYLRGGRKKPEEIKQFMTEGYSVYKWFAERSQR